MVRAILEGRKTQTRRIINPQPQRHDSYWHFDKQVFMSDDDLVSYLFHDYYDKHPRYGAAYVDGTADVLWVRESWQAQNSNGQWWHEVKREDRLQWNWAWTNPVRAAYDDMPPKWLPSIHMPKMACRIRLEIVNVRVERVKEITPEDAQSEGCYSDKSIEIAGQWSIVTMFSRLWNSINTDEGKRWEDNPWVWVIEFKVL